MIAFYFVPGYVWGSALLLPSALAALFLFMVFAGPSPTISRWRVLILTGVIVSVCAARVMFAADGIPVVCDTMPWWTLEYLLFCYFN